MVLTFVKEFCELSKAQLRAGLFIFELILSEYCDARCLLLSSMGISFASTCRQDVIARNELHRQLRRTNITDNRMKSESCRRQSKLVMNRSPRYSEGNIEPSSVSNFLCLDKLMMVSLKITVLLSAGD